MGEGTRVLAVLCAGALAACARAGQADSSSQVATVGNPAPPWSEPSLAGPKISLAGLRGKAIYLNFFATWCPPCNAEAPVINSIQRAYGARGLQVVGVDVLEDAQKAAQFSKAHRLIYPVVVDGGTLRDQYRVNDLPVQVFIDRTGVVRQIVVGQVSPDVIKADAERLLQ
jgi:cytochrome c biogenesis protein CcmG, thiol:disulfide interchange protein DsbE